MVTGLLKFVHLHHGVSCRDTFITWLLVCVFLFYFYFCVCNCLDQDRDLNRRGNILSRIVEHENKVSQSPVPLPASYLLRLCNCFFFLYVIQEEADKPRILSSQRLSPKWCFLDCKYISLLRFYSFPHQFYYLDTLVCSPHLP